MAYIRKPKAKNTKIATTPGGEMTPEVVIEIASKNGLETEPLDVVSLVKKLGIMLRFEPMGDEDSGLLAKDKEGNWFMHINSLHHPNRQRFTIAHELGHLFLHGDVRDEFADKIFFRNNQLDKDETEANIYAAQLLMPKKLFSAYISDTSSKVEDIANHFQVSSLAVRYRAKTLGYSGHNV
jgi:Zn-dependent peptidase ImmA (M78 family)